MSKLHHKKMRQQLVETGALFTVPDGALYYCMEHQEFIHDKPQMRTHMGSAVHQTKGVVQCQDCLNYFSSKKELAFHRNLMGNHTFPYPVRTVNMRNGRIVGGEQENPAVLVNDVNTEAGVEDDVEEEVSKVLCIGSVPACIQGLTPQEGQLHH